MRGEGIEIGALQNPVKAPHLKVHYVDRYSRAQLYESYPELRNQPIVDPDIIDDAESLKSVPDGSQDFVIANHVIEHMANPIGALLNWARVLKDGGRLFLAVPDKHTTFDANRPLTPLSHVIEDYKSPSRERDYPHFVEFAREVSCRTFNMRPVEEHEIVAKDLFEKDYSIHFHVWDREAFRELLTYLSKELSGWRCEICGSSPTTGNEFIFVLERQRRL